MLSVDMETIILGSLYWSAYKEMLKINDENVQYICSFDYITQDLKTNKIKYAKIFTLC